MDDYQRWFASMMQSGLDEHLLEPADVLAHITPEVLAEHLPADVLARVLESSLSAGAMTPQGILDTATPELLARHVPRETLWACIAGGARRAGLGETRS